MQFKKVLPVLLTFCLVFTGCGKEQQSQEPASASEMEAVNHEESAVLQDDSLTTLDSILDLINNQHRAYQKPQVKLLDYIADDDDDFDIFEYTLDMSQPQSYDGEISMTLEQAQEDVEVLFAALRSTYGPYHYFGGDAVFEPVKESIMQACEELEEAEGLESQQLTNLIHSTLMDVIHDGHFQVNFTRLHPLKLAYLYPSALFSKLDNGGYLSRDGRVLESVDGWQNPDDLMRLTITDTGDVAYCPVVFKEADQEMSLPEELVLHYTDGSSSVAGPDPWESWYEDDERTVELSYNAGIPVLFARNMGFEGADEDIFNGREFLDYASQLKGEPVVILDLRSNGGGNGVLPLKWLSEWSGGKVTTNSVGIQYLSEDYIREFSQNTDNNYYNSYEDFTEVLDMRPLNDQYMSYADVEDQFVENDSILIVLTSKNTGSAAETFTDAAKNVGNVLIVGENTTGITISNAYVTIALPHSGTMITLGCNLLFHPDEVEEFTGILPDIWVNGDAEEAVMRMLRNLAPSLVGSE